MQKRSLVTLEGRNTVLETLKSNRYIKNIYIQKGAKGDKIQSIVSLSQKKEINIVYCDANKLKQLSNTHASEGVLALAKPVEYISTTQFLQNSTEYPQTVAILKGVLHQQNLGAVIRSAASFGINGLVLCSKGVKITPEVERVAMGGTNYVSLIKESFYSSIKNLQKASYKIVAFENNARTSFYNEDLSENIALIFGDESETLNSSLSKKLDSYLKIPMTNLSSVNLSVSCGIVFSECYKQKYGKTL